MPKEFRGNTICFYAELSMRSRMAVRLGDPRRPEPRVQDRDVVIGAQVDPPTDAWLELQLGIHNSRAALP